MPPLRDRLRELVAHALFAIRTAVEGVAHNTLRAGLTSLGILFGVASVIAMLAIGRGAEQEILEQMRLLGTNNVIVTPIVEQKEEEAKDEGRQEPKRYSPGLSRDDARAVAAIVPGIDATSGEVVLNTMATREGRRRSVKLVGVDTAYFRLLNLHVADGSFFSRQQVAGAAPVAVIGKGLKARFFTTEDPIGRPIKVGDVWLTVVGVLEDRQVATENADRLGIRDANMDVYVPLSTMLLRSRNRPQLTNRDLEAASRDFPPGMAYSIPYNPTEYVQASVEEVQRTPSTGCGSAWWTIIRSLPRCARGIYIAGSTITPCTIRRSCRATSLRGTISTRRYRGKRSWQRSAMRPASISGMV